MYDRDNVFAKILRGEIPSFKVFESDRALSFMDAMPQSDGHTLVIPKVEARNLFDISPDALGKLVQDTQYVARAVQTAFNPDGMRIIQFNEPAAGQTVFHIHFHIIPCYEGVEMRGHARGWADKAVLAQHAERIKAAFASLPAHS
jgi:histidine triad (HIT) family protein